MTVGDIKSGGKERWHATQLGLYCAATVDPLIRFEEEGHRYYRGAIELPSVTRILNPAPNPFYGAGAAARGHNVHRMCVLDAQGVLDEATVDEEYLGWLHAWRRFRQDLLPCFIELEQIVGDAELGFAGRRDLLIEIPGWEKELTACDIYLGKNGRYSIDVLEGLRLSEEIAKGRKAVQEWHEKRFELTF
jgi:hypothetical protein